MFFGIGSELLATIVVIIAVIVINLGISGMLRRRSRLSRETKLRASVFWRNAAFLFALLALLFVWREELRAAAFSFAALSVSLVIAGKELLTSMLGYVHRTTAKSFRFGDVIEINGVRGEVIDQTLLATTLLEMSEEHQFTGRTVQFPNSFYVSYPLKNHSRIGLYQLGILVVPVVAGGDIERAKDRLEQIAAQACSDFVGPAEVALRELEGEQFVVMPSAEPRVTLRLMDDGRVALVLRYPCPAENRTRTEQQILARYLEGAMDRTRSAAEAAQAEAVRRV